MKMLMGNANGNMQAMNQIIIVCVNKTGSAFRETTSFSAAMKNFFSSVTLKVLSHHKRN